MGTYPFVFGYPVILLTMDFYLLRRFGTSKSWWHHPRAAQIWLEKVPFLVLSSLLLVTFQGRLNPTGIWKAQELQDQFGFLLSRYAGILCLGLLCLEAVCAF
jgi:hypothetical protein